MRGGRRPECERGGDEEERKFARDWTSDFVSKLLVDMVHDSAFLSVNSGCGVGISFIPLQST